MADTLKRQLGLGLLTAYGVMAGAGVISLAVTLKIASLKKITTMALLVVFAIVNAALIGLKRRSPVSPFDVPVIVSWFGLFACLAAFAAAIGGRL